MYDASMFTVALPERPTKQEVENFDYSLACQVQMFWDGADADTIKAFRGMRRKHIMRDDQDVKIILRIQPDDLFRPRHILQGQFAEKQAVAHGNIVAIILGNEHEPPMPGLRWRRPDGSIPNWGNVTSVPNAQSPIDYWKEAIMRGANSLKDTGVTLVTGAFAAHGYTEDDPPDPGLFTWRELVAPVYYGYDSPVGGNGVHYYDGGWWERDPALPIVSTEAPHPYFSMRDMQAYAGALAATRVATKTNVDRFKQAVRFWSGFHHHLCYWDESNTKNSHMSMEQHMEACIGKSKLLIHSKNAEGYILGERVAMFSPFTSNGLGNAYPVEYIMNNRACYELIRSHMIEEGYVA